MWKKSAVNTVTSIKDLFYCPFCGCHGFSTIGNFVQVVCDTCGARGPIKDESTNVTNYSDEDAYTAWNKRDYDCLCLNCERGREHCDNCILNEIGE